jgi:hypothetical protein
MKRPAEARCRLDWPHHNQSDEEWLWLLSDYNMKLYSRSVMQSWR